MAVRDYDITVREADFSHVADYRAKCAPGVVMVEMAPREDQVGSLYVPDVLKNRLRADVAVVVGLGGETKAKSGKRTLVANPEDELKVGDVVVVDYSRGYIMSGFGWYDESIARSETRVYGQAGSPDSFHRNYPYWEAILMKQEGSEFQPVGANVVLKYREKQDTTEGGLLLPDRSKARDPVADVYQVGPRCEELRPGMAVLPNKQWFRCCDVENDLFVGPESAVLAWTE